MLNTTICFQRSLGSSQGAERKVIERSKRIFCW